MRITNGSAHYYASTVSLDGVEIIDFIWADEEAGEVMSVTYGPREGVQARDKEAFKGQGPRHHHLKADQLRLAWHCEQDTKRTPSAQLFIYRENTDNYRKLIADAKADPKRDEVRYQVLLRLLADEEAKLVEALGARRSS